MVPHLVARDGAEPAGEIPAVELPQASEHDQKNALSEIVRVAAVGGQGSCPLSNLSKPVFVDRHEEIVDRRAGSDGRGGDREPRSGLRGHHVV